MTNERNFEEFMPPLPPSRHEETSYPHNIYLEPGEFHYITKSNERELLTNAWNAIMETQMWDFMSKEMDIYAFNNSKEVELIYNKMEELGYLGHSAYLFGWTMRQMQYIAKYGEETYMKEILTPLNK
jgi:hypothetical protein